MGAYNFAYDIWLNGTYASTGHVELEIFDYMIAEGWIKASMPLSEIDFDFDFGVGIADTGGAARTFQVTDFSILTQLASPSAIN